MDVVTEAGKRSGTQFALVIVTLYFRFAVDQYVVVGILQMVTLPEFSELDVELVLNSVDQVADASPAGHHLQLPVRCWCVALHVFAEQPTDFYGPVSKSQISTSRVNSKNPTPLSSDFNNPNSVCTHNTNAAKGLVAKFLGCTKEP